MNWTLGMDGILLRDQPANGWVGFVCLFDGVDE
jgi:hypothetical protein